jgi:hypothetical protein
MEEKVEDDDLGLIEKIYQQRFKNNVFKFKERNNSLLIKREDTISKSIQHT